MEAAFTAGRISTAHVGVIAEAAAQIPRFPKLEAAVVELVETTEPGEVRRVLQVLVDQSRPDALDEEQDAQVQKRSLSLSPTPSGVWRLDGRLDNIDGQRLSDALVTFIDRPPPATVEASKPGVLTRWPTWSPPRWPTPNR